MIYYLCRALARVVFRLVGRWQIVGRGSVPAEGGVIIAANHVSFADPPAVGCALIRPTNFMAKAELFRVPVLGWVIRKCHSFPVRRGEADMAAMRTAVHLLRSGETVTIFPEGQRSPNGKLQEPEAGVGIIVRRAGVPVVPVALIDTDCMLPRRSLYIRFSRVKVIFGEPITFDAPEYSGKDGTRRIGERIMSEIAALLNEHSPPPTYTPV
jgi:1-acyl-sn-glycerol-3-phosphate acyltransferase